PASVSATVQPSSSLLTDRSPEGSVAGGGGSVACLSSESQGTPLPSPGSSGSAFPIKTSLLARSRSEFAGPEWRSSATCARLGAPPPSCSAPSQGLSAGGEALALSGSEPVSAAAGAKAASCSLALSKSAKAFRGLFNDV